MIGHPRVLLQQLAPGDIEVVYQSALRILEQTGMVIQSDQACEYASLNSWPSMRRPWRSMSLETPAVIISTMNTRCVISVMKCTSPCSFHL